MWTHKTISEKKSSPQRKPSPRKGLSKDLCKSVCEPALNFTGARCYMTELNIFKSKGECLWNDAFYVRASERKVNKAVNVRGAFARFGLGWGGSADRPAAVLCIAVRKAPEELT